MEDGPVGIETVFWDSISLREAIRRWLELPNEDQPFVTIWGYVENASWCRPIDGLADMARKIVIS